MDLCHYIESFEPEEPPPFKGEYPHDIVLRRLETTSPHTQRQQQDWYPGELAPVTTLPVMHCSLFKYAGVRWWEEDQLLNEQFGEPVGNWADHVRREVEQGWSNHSTKSWNYWEWLGVVRKANSERLAAQADMVTSTSASSRWRSTTRLPRADDSDDEVMGYDICQYDSQEKGYAYGNGEHHDEEDGW